jgi:hypothetical protein
VHRVEKVQLEPAIREATARLVSLFKSGGSCLLPSRPRMTRMLRFGCTKRIEVYRFTGMSVEHLGLPAARTFHPGITPWHPSSSSETQLNAQRRLRARQLAQLTGTPAQLPEH